MILLAREFEGGSRSCSLGKQLEERSPLLRCARESKNRQKVVDGFPIVVHPGSLQRFAKCVRPPFLILGRRMLVALIAGCALFGLIVGSFLNVVIYRVPRKESIVTPRSHCPSCNALIKEYDNIPVFSWLVLKGKCRHCGEAISPRYLFVELATAALFAGLAARLGYNWELSAFLVLFAGLLALACIDLELLLLPRSVVYPVLLLVAGLLIVAAAVSGDWHRLLVAAICSVAWYVLFFLINLISPRILGFGDVRLALLLGLGLGWFGWRFVVIGFFAANVIGAVIGLTLIATKRMSHDQPIPYAVFLALGTAFAVFAGPEIAPLFSNIH